MTYLIIMLDFAKVVRDGAGNTRYEYMYKMWDAYRRLDMSQQSYDSCSPKLEFPLEERYDL